MQEEDIFATINPGVSEFNKKQMLVIKIINTDSLSI